jgi:hypothetical protein
MAWTIFSFRLESPLFLPPSAAVTEDGKPAKHVLIFCPWYAWARHELRDEHGHLPNYSKLLGTADGLRKTTKWVMQRGILGQFREARDALYGPPSFSPEHRTNVGFVLRYWRLLGTLQITH